MYQYVYDIVKYSSQTIIQYTFYLSVQVRMHLKSTSILNLEHVRHTSGHFYSGVLVGISRVLFDYLAAEEANMSEHLYYRLSKVVTREVSYLDQRLTWPVSNISFDAPNTLEIGTSSFGDWMPSMKDGYVVLAPHQLVLPEVSWTLFWQRTLLLGLIIGTTLCILAIRLCCRRIEVPASPTNRDALLFDTFARTLGLSAGNWLGRSSSERQLLAVLSTFAILMGGVFSGVLYEHNFPNEAKERFNTVYDICAAGLNVTIEPAVIFALSLIAGEITNLRHLK